jgi:hypothetical protein
VFILMPFKPELSDTYKFGLKASADEVGAYAERVDDQHYDGSVIGRIINQISKADVIVADMTGKNPNVYYEVGYAHALGKIVILATQDIHDIPFDFRDRPHIPYKTIDELKAKLIPRLAWAIEESRKGKGAPIVNPIELFLNGVRISSSGTEPATSVQLFAPLGHAMLVDVLIRNSSGAVLQEPISHVYLYLEPNSLLSLDDYVQEGFWTPSAPVFTHSKPVEENFTRQFRIQMEPVALPPYAIDKFLIRLHPTVQLPPLTSVNALFEVLVAGTAVRFRCRFECIRS